ncbi:hypothetical protein ABOC32_15440 [Pseudomonas sp. WOUb67]
MTLTLNHNGFDDGDNVFMSLALALQDEAERDLHQYLVNND